MASRFMIKLMVAIMESIIFIAVKVQANDLTTTRYHSSSLPIPISHSSKLDTIEKQFINCVLVELEICENGYKEDREKYVECAIKHFANCIVQKMLDLKHPVLDVAVNCFIFCISMSFTKPFRLEACFINCYDAHNKRH